MENNKRIRDIDTFEEEFSNDVKTYCGVRKRRVRPTPPVELYTKELEEREKLEEHEKCEEREELDLYCYENFKDFDKNVSSSLPPLCHCVECFAYMGEMNPRQYCYKTYCTYSNFESSDLLAMQVFHLRISPYYDDPEFIYYSKYHDIIQKFITANNVPVTDDQTQFLPLNGSDSEDQT